jgi:teichuronic acid biosynthesis glycosyltransferase TuaH
VGHINARIDIDLLEAVVAAGASLLLVGPMDAGFEPDRMGQLLSQPTVHWTGPVPYSRLAGYLAIIDTGLVPYTRSGFNLGSFPLKTLEYLSAGVPPVSTDLPSTRWFNTDLIAIADEPTRFAQVVLEQAERRSDPAAIERRRAFAGQHDWASRARAMLAAIEAAQR